MHLRSKTVQQLLSVILPDGATIDLTDGTTSTLTGGSRSTVYSSGEVKLAAAAA